MTNDIVHAWRALRAMPLVSSVIVASLAIGIGANTVVFSWLQMVRWKPLPGVTAAYALQTIEPRTDTGSYVGASWLEFRDLRPRLGSFQSLLASRMAPLTIGDGAYTGAGTTVRHDVPPGALAINSSPQQNVPGWVARRRPGTPSAEAAERAAKGDQPLNSSQDPASTTGA